MKTFVKNLILLAALTFAPTVAVASGFDYEYDFKVDGLCYVKKSDSVSVALTREKYSNDNYSYLSGEIVIPSAVTYNDVTYPVTSIAHDAFTYCGSITSVIIPNTVTSIGSEAFARCTGLMNVSIPESVIDIGSSAFINCSSLARIAIPNSVTTIGACAFASCSSLTEINIPNMLTKIENRLFSNCSSLTNLTLPNSVTAIDREAFLCCISLSNIIIPDAVKSIGRLAFSRCSSLTCVVIPDSVTTVGGRAFYGCEGLESVSIGKAVTSVDSETFLECPNLVELTWNAIDCKGELGAVNSQLNRVVIGPEVETLPAKFVNYSQITSLEIPNSVVTIEDEAFRSCKGLTSIAIPSSVTSIGRDAFIECSGLESIEVEEANTHYDSRENCNAIINSESNILILGCMNSVVPNTIVAIGYRSFKDCIGLTNITIPTSVEKISGDAFYGCSRLMEITIPSSVTSIVGYPFYGCSDLETIVVEDGNPKYDSRNNCNAIIQTYGNVLIAGCKNTIVPNNVRGIGAYAFGGNAKLSSVNIPESIISIGNNAFIHCTALMEIKSYPDPSSVSLAGGVFYNVPKNKCLLKVKDEYVNSYRNADQWKELIVIGGLEDVLIPGDTNGDGRVNVSDVTTLVNMILGVVEKDEQLADVNGDGKVNVSDVTALINIILGVK